jgi:hypothetical protein
MNQLHESGTASSNAISNTKPESTANDILALQQLHRKLLTNLREANNKRNAPTRIKTTKTSIDCIAI